jgi:hypothetical protein
MIKQFPQDYAHILAFQSNALFAMVHWSKSWKHARTLCFNKTHNPAPSTQQLRPISLLPVLGKVYERLFLLRFQKWLQSYNIIPWRQSGSRTNLSTNSRVSHLLEQLTNSLRYNTFTSVIFVGFKQAFDLLRQEGLILNLNRLHCPIPYLLWITNYFKDRSMSIDFNGHISGNIAIARGAPQGSVFGAIAYIVAHHDLPQIFERPENNHLYVDDPGSIYIPNIYCDFKKQLVDVEQRMNKDLKNLRNYAKQWHQPMNGEKTQVVLFTQIVRHPKLNLHYEDTVIEQTKVFRYLGYQMDSKLPLKQRSMISYRNADGLTQYQSIFIGNFQPSIKSSTYQL